MLGQRGAACMLRSHCCCSSAASFGSSATLHCLRTAAAAAVDYDAGGVKVFESGAILCYLAGDSLCMDPTAGIVTEATANGCYGSVLVASR